MKKSYKIALLALLILILGFIGFFAFVKQDLVLENDPYAGHGEECTYIDYDCQPGFKHFYDGIGCGCAATTP